MFFFKQIKPTDEFLAQAHANQAIIHKVCNMYANTKADREDLFQEMLIQLWRAFPKYKAEAKFTSWMYQICLNTAISGLRKEKRKPLFSFFTHEDLTKIPIEFHGANEEDEAQLQALYEAISQLGDIDKAIILLYIEENSYEEIAKIIGISITNVGVKINRIKSKLEIIVKQNQNV